MPRPAESFAGMRRGWQALLDLGFGLVCVWYLLDTAGRADSAFLLVGAVGFGLAWWRASASFFALVLTLPVLSGWQLTVFSPPYSLLLAVASAMWLGGALRQRLSAFAAPPAADTRSDWITLLVELLATAALFCVFAQLWRDRSEPFPSSAFVWLHGLFYFRAWRAHSATEMLTRNGIKLALLVNSLGLLFFFALQAAFDLPARWTPGFQLPFEDIATFGIMATCLALHHCAQLRRDLPSGRLVLHATLAVLLIVAASLSYSRGSWLALGMALGLLAWLRLSRYFTLFLFGLGLGAIVFLNLNADRLPLANWPNLEKLVNLVRWESPHTKNSDRLELYHKAFSMTRERPWTGHGIGSFYWRATDYSRPGDPNGQLHQLPHNLILQLAAEQGLPVAGLFIGLMGATLWRGARCWLTARRLPADPPADSHPWPTLTLGLTLMLGAYLQANMTWDMLTVHPSQPFFFWFLVAALWAVIRRPAAA